MSSTSPPTLSLSSAENIVKELLGEDNPYLIKILDRELNNTSKRTVSSKFHEIGRDLQKKIDLYKSDVELQQRPSTMVINTILKEKLADRSELLQVRRHRFILTLVSLILPIATNIAQYLITRWN